MSSKYGDDERIQADAAVIREIQSRQGSTLLIEIIAEACALVAIKYNLPADEILQLRENLVNELNEAIKERT